MRTRVRKRTRTRRFFAGAFLALVALSPLAPVPAHAVPALGAVLAAPASAAVTAARAARPVGVTLRRTPRPARPGARLTPSLTPTSLAFLSATTRPWASALAAGGLALLIALAWWMLGFVGKSSRTRGQPRTAEFAL